MAVQGNDHAALRAKWDAKKAERDQARGGFRLRLGTEFVELRPGQLTFQQRREIRRRIGVTVEEVAAELASGAGSIETVAALAWIGAYQEDPTDPPDIDGLMKWLGDELDPGQDIDVEVFDADEAGDPDPADPTNSEPSSQGSEPSPLSLPDLV